MTHTFNVVYEDAGEGWVYAHVPELPEVHTQGETLDQAREMARDAIALVLDERRARGEVIPASCPRATKAEWSPRGRPVRWPAVES